MTRNKLSMSVGRWLAEFRNMIAKKYLWFVSAFSSIPSCAYLPADCGQKVLFLSRLVHTEATDLMKNRRVLNRSSRALEYRSNRVLGSALYMSDWIVGRTFGFEDPDP